jgi:hypothetical protein
VGFVGPEGGGEVGEDAVEEGVYHVVIVVVAVTTMPPQKLEPEPEPGTVETRVVGVLGLELGLEPEAGALYANALELVDGVLWTWFGAAREEDTMVDGEEAG